MNTNRIELTKEEEAILAQVDFNPSSEIHNVNYWKSVGAASQKLMESLIARKAIPELRMKFFTDPDFNIRGRGRSRADVFEKNGTRGDAILRHPHFLKYLHYFLYGPDLPAAAIFAFQEKIAECRFISSSDIMPLGAFARQLIRQHTLDSGNAAEEFFKLALECGLELTWAQAIRDAVKKAR